MNSGIIVAQMPSKMPPKDELDHPDLVTNLQAVVATQVVCLDHAEALSSHPPILLFLSMHSYSPQAAEITFIGSIILIRP
jgi:hypothetical protein